MRVCSSSFRAQGSLGTEAITHPAAIRVVVSHCGLSNSAVASGGRISPHFLLNGSSVDTGGPRSRLGSWACADVDDSPPLIVVYLLGQLKSCSVRSSQVEVFAPTVL